MLEIQLKCFAIVDNIEFLDNECIKILKKSQFENYKKLSFAIHEVIINCVQAMVEKFGEDNKENITIDIKADKYKAEVIVRDTAGGISEKEWNCINKKDFNDVLMDDRGRGFLFIKHLVDSFDYYIDSNGESTFKLTKGCEYSE